MGKFAQLRVQAPAMGKHSHRVQGKLVPIEERLSATPRPAMAGRVVVHPGEVKLPLGPQATAIPFAQL